MSSRHEDGHELLLQELLTASPADAARLKELSDCPLCGPRLEEMLGLRQSLTNLGREQREVLRRLDAGEAVDDFGGARVVEAFLAAHEAETAAAASPARTSATAMARTSARGSRIVGALLAACLLALVAWRLLATDSVSPSKPPTQEPVLLGTERTKGLVPRGAGARFTDPFRWELPLEAWFVVRVFAANEDGGETLLATSPRVEGQEWSWSGKEASGWPDRIRWEVRSYDAFGSVLESAETHAWR